MLDARVAVRVFATCALAGSLACADREPTGIEPSARLALVKSSGDVQFGSASDDITYAIGAGKLGVAVVGTTLGALPGQTNAGGLDAYVRLSDKRGAVLWTKQFGTSADDGAFGVAVDKSGVYVAGASSGSLVGANIGFSDGFVRKYDAAGNIVWMTRLASAGADSAFGLAVDNDAVYVTGELRGGINGGTTDDANGYAIKLDAQTGQVLWMTYFVGGDGGDDGARAATVSGDALFVAATYFGGSLGGGPGVEDAYIVRLNAITGAIEWYSAVESAGKDVGWAVTYDAGSVFLAGQWGGDSFVAAFTALTGAMQWRTTLSTAFTDLATTVAIDRSTLHVGGWTSGEFPGMSNAGLYDAFHATLNATTGQILGVNQFGTTGLDAALGSFLDGKLWHLVGTTGGGLVATNLGGLDAWLMQIGVR